MDKNRLIEKKHCTFNGKEVRLPNEIYLDTFSLSNCEVFLEGNVLVKDLSNDVIIICNKDDLDAFLESLEINLPIEFFRLEIKSTKKWGMKPLFLDGPNSVCFSIKKAYVNDCLYLFFFNTHGTREMELVYFHGLWEIPHHLGEHS